MRAAVAVPSRVAARLPRLIRRLTPLLDLHPDAR